MYFSKEMQEASLKLTKKWEDEVKKALKNNPDQKERFSTVSDMEIKRLYTPEDIKDINFGRHQCSGRISLFTRKSGHRIPGTLLDIPHVFRHGQRAGYQPALAHASAPRPDRT